MSLGTSVDVPSGSARPALGARQAELAGARGQQLGAARQLDAGAGAERGVQGRGEVVDAALGEILGGQVIEAVQRLAALEQAIADEPASGGGDRPIDGGRGEAAAVGGA